MPKGHVPEREVVCKACGTPFMSRRAGKSAYYCRRPECDEWRRRTGFTISNPGGYGDRVSAEERRRRAARREAERLERQRARAAARARARAERLRPRAEKAAAHAIALRDELRGLERQAGLPLSPLLGAKAEVVVERPVIRDAQLAAIADLLADRPRDVEPGRLALRKAVARLAYARGLGPTRAALRHLVVEALAWDDALPRIVRDVAGIDVVREDVAA